MSLHVNVGLRGKRISDRRRTTAPLIESLEVRQLMHAAFPAVVAEPPRFAADAQDSQSTDDTQNPALTADAEEDAWQVSVFSSIQSSGGSGGGTVGTPTMRNQKKDDCPPPARNTTGDPVRYADGVVNLTFADLPSTDPSWGFTRNWTNDERYIPNDSSGYRSTAFGNNVGSTQAFVEQLPDVEILIPSDDPMEPPTTRVQQTLVLVYNGYESEYFTRTVDDASDASIQYESDYQGERIDYDPTGLITYMLRRRDGSILAFNDDGSLVGSSTVDGDRSVSIGYAGPGLPSVMYRQQGLSPAPGDEKIEFTYSGGQLDTVTQFVWASSGWGETRNAHYTYYGYDETGGLLGDLKYAEIRDRDDNVLETKYYRYYTSSTSSGFAHGLKQVFDADAFVRLASAYSDYDTREDWETAPYADMAFTYDGSRRVSSETVQGGCSTCSGGVGTYQLSYATPSGKPDGRNVWKYKTIETLPDGNTNTVYSNYRGEVILKVFEEDEAKYPEYWHYNASGDDELYAGPSAIISGYNEGLDALVDDAEPGNATYIRDDVGYVVDYQYDDDISGMSRLEKVVERRGESGAEHVLEKYTYSNTVVVPGFVPVTKVERYPVNGGLSEATEYAYTYANDRVESITTTLPIVTSNKNGPGGNDALTQTAVYDNAGRVIWTKDAGGYVNYYEYDAFTGAMTLSVIDANTSLLSGVTVPTGFATSSGLHLDTIIDVDFYGRPTLITDPLDLDTVITYDDYSDDGDPIEVITVREEGPTEVWRHYRPAPGSGDPVYDEYLTYDGTLTASNVQSLTFGNIQSLRREITNDAGQVVFIDEYHSLTSYTPDTATLGTLDANYHRTEYAYDARGRVKMVKNPIGTIRWNVFDGRGLPKSSWIGTDATDATNADPDGPGGNSNNMLRVADYVYDGGGIGDGNLTAVYEYPDAQPDFIDESPNANSTTPDRVTRMYYDWRNRLVATKYGDDYDETGDGEDLNANRQVQYLELDNLGRVTATEWFDGDGESVTYTDPDDSGPLPVNGEPDKPEQLLRRSRDETYYDEWGQVYRTVQVGIDQADGGVLTGVALTTDFWYDDRGNLVKTKTPQGLASKTQYDGAGRVTKSFLTDANEAGQPAALDVVGDRVLEQAEYLYDDNGNVLLVTTRQRFHDVAGTNELGDRNSGTTAARVSYVAYYYDEANRLVKQLDAGTAGGGSLFTRPEDLTYEDPAVEDGDQLLTTYEYDDAGRLGTVTNPDEQSTVALYDLLGRATSVVENYVDGGPSDADDRTTGFAYDGIGNVTTQTAWLKDGPDSDSDLDFQTTQYVYGPQAVSSGGGLTSSGGVATATVPGHGYHVGESVVVSGASSGYNGTFTVLGVPTADTFTFAVTGSPASPATGRILTRRASTVAENDTLKIVKYPNPSTGTASGVPAGQEVYAYNALGDLSGMTDRNQTEHAYAYDVMGRRLRDSVVTINASGASWFIADYVRTLATAYDSAGRAATFTSAGLVQDVDGIEQTTLNGLTARVTVTAGHGYANGMSVIITGADQPEYNGTFVISNVTSTSFDYMLLSDPEGNETEATGDHIVVNVLNQVKREFNGLGQLTAEYQEHYDKVVSTSPTVQYAYDAANGSRLMSMTYPNGRVLSYDYGTANGLNDQISRIESLRESGTTSPLEQYSYLGLGTIVQRAHSEPGVNLTYVGSTPGDAGDQYAGLDRFGRVVDQRWVKTSTSTDVDRFTYTYDRNSNRLTRGWTTTSGKDEAYTYDGLNRLTKMDRGSLNSGSIASPTYTRDWTSGTGAGLDALGNWQSMTTDSNGSASGGATTHTRSHDSQNRLTAVGSNGFQYDDNGNVYVNDQSHVYIYDAWNRLIGVQTGPADVYYMYDALGRRIQTFGTGVAPVADHYHSAGWQVIEERDSNTGDVTAQNVWSLAYVDAMVLRDRDAASGGNLGKSGSGLDERLYAVQDANFNVTALTDTSGAVVERYQYDPYGSFTVLDANFSVDINGQSDVDWVHLHQGGRHDAVIGLYHFRHRDYSPILGRLVQADPLTYVDGLNVYQWELGNPNNNLDPLGLEVPGYSHSYPLFLGGNPNQPGFYLNWPDHTKFHDVLRKYGVQPPVRGPRATDWSGAASNWAKLTPDAQKTIIREAMRAANIPDELIDQYIDDIMKGAIPGKNRTNERPRGPAKTCGPDEMKAARARAAAAAAEAAKKSNAAMPRSAAGGPKTSVPASSSAPRAAEAPRSTAAKAPKFPKPTFFQRMKFLGKGIMQIPSLYFDMILDHDRRQQPGYIDPDNMA